MKEIIDKILNNYINQRTNHKFKENPFVKEIVNILPKAIHDQSRINPNNYKIYGSAGMGVWTYTPWVGIFDKQISESAAKGFYIVYLFCEDMGGVYLSLNQGWTWYKKTYGSKLGRNKIIEIATHLRSMFRSNISGFPENTIDLHSTLPLGKGYEAGNILAKFYPKDSIPDDSILIDDLRTLIGIFSEMKNFIPKKNDDLRYWVNTWDIIIDSQIEEDDGIFQTQVTRIEPKNFVDNPKELPKKNISSSRTTWKRNPQTAQNALYHANYQCEIDHSHKTFISKSSGKQYVEAHHIIPLSNQDKYNINLDVEANIVALCPTCHRKIHFGLLDERKLLQQQLINQRKIRLNHCGILV